MFRTDHCGTCRYLPRRSKGGDSIDEEGRRATFQDGSYQGRRWVVRALESRGHFATLRTCGARTDSACSHHADTQSPDKRHRGPALLFSAHSHPSIFRTEPASTIMTRFLGFVLRVQKTIETHGPTGAFWPSLLPNAGRPAPFDCRLGRSANHGRPSRLRRRGHRVIGSAPNPTNQSSTETVSFAHFSMTRPCTSECLGSPPKVQWRHSPRSYVMGISTGDSLRSCTDRRLFQRRYKPAT